MRMLCLPYYPKATKVYSQAGGKEMLGAKFYGAQVSIVSEGFLKSQLLSVQIQDVEQLLGSNGSLSLQAVNGTDIP
ncbi:hypothetical protein pdam_00000108 [Pocillopora damicornis]|uniref:Uncharacterized protein n=1 Tax=Pocillopora damicornis TaxID=46731 RepID=A0A3M6UWV7_POCDA|nr:hypothetical protein pdam_00000108 [Pocillopora damicornis]